MSLLPRSAPQKKVAVTTKPRLRTLSDSDTGAGGHPECCCEAREASRAALHDGSIRGGHPELLTRAFCEAREQSARFQKRRAFAARTHGHPPGPTHTEPCPSPPQSVSPRTRTHGAAAVHGHARDQARARHQQRVSAGTRSSAAPVTAKTGEARARAQTGDKVQALEKLNLDLEQQIRLILQQRAKSATYWSPLREQWEREYREVKRGERERESKRGREREYRERRESLRSDFCANAKLLLETENIQNQADDFKDRSVTPPHTHTYCPPPTHTHILPPPHTHTRSRVVLREWSKAPPQPKATLLQQRITPPRPWRLQLEDSLSHVSPSLSHPSLSLGGCGSIPSVRGDSSWRTLSLMSSCLSHVSHVFMSLSLWGLRLDGERPWRQQLEDDISSLHKVMDEASETRLELQRRTDDLWAELQQLQIGHQQDVHRLYAQDQDQPDSVQTELDQIWTTSSSMGESL
ncbi:hypothetical protein WMY93_031646 [Mugilogobius chulae]|uniref:Uncharacterized protein n=1 Tax=Mugilogobius chulae TaxID=88201 RepID=A0AAW0MFG8_9GOBI